MQVKPEEMQSICIIETDLEVDFAAPVGYVEPSVKPKRPNVEGSTMSIEQHIVPDKEFKVFTGTG